MRLLLASWASDEASSREGIAENSCLSVQWNRATNPFTEKENSNALHHDRQRKLRQHRSLLQRLGQRTARGLQPWLAAERGRLGGPNDVSGLPWIPLHCP